MMMRVVKLLLNSTSIGLGMSEDLDFETQAVYSTD
jgi:hypothetical protein